MDDIRIVLVLFFAALGVGGVLLWLDAIASYLADIADGMD